jgi:pimeloyl-ACP methyl ester carboxylesterase
MSQDVVSFQSAGLRLHGVLSVPEGVRPGERRAAFLVLHGFGSNSESPTCITPARVLNEFGFVTLRFDMRGCGKSEGEFGRVICLEQVEDTGNALDFLAKHPAVDPDRIGVIGSSFGGAVGVYAGGTNPRIAAVVSNGGWGHGERKFRGQHPTPEGWAKFTKMLEEGREHRARTGKSLMVPRYDIVPIPDHVRENLDKQKVAMLAPKSVEMFPAETAQSMFGGGRQHRAAAALAHPCRQRFGDADRTVGGNVQARRPAERAAPVQRPRSLPVRGEVDAGMDHDARLARQLFPGGEAITSFVSRAQRSMKRSGMMRCRPGIVTNAATGTIPDQRCTASRCIASGKRTMGEIG